MRCHQCKRPVAAGVEARKMIVEYTQPDDTVRTFGHLMSDGPLTAATGRLLRGWHNKCYHIARKREARGDAVTGRVLASGAATLPTGYDIDTVGTEAVSESLAVMRAIARQVGKPVGDPHVTEAYRAKVAGGPYPHTHQMPLETYQLLAHLRYAHGQPFSPPHRSARDMHEHLHAQAAAAQHARRRAADAATERGETRTEETDWREQVVTEVQDLK